MKRKQRRGPIEVPTNVLAALMRDSMDDHGIDPAVLLQAGRERFIELMGMLVARGAWPCRAARFSDEDFGKVYDRLIEELAEE